MKLVSLTIILAAAVATSAFPSNASLGDSCTISSYHDVSTVTKKCTTITIKGFTVPAGKTLDLELKSGSKVTITGIINFNYHEWEGPLMQISGSGVTVSGASGVHLEGNGAKYWDGKGDKGKSKPKFVKVKTTGHSVIRNLDLKDCPRQCFSVEGSDTEFIGCDVDVSAGSSKGKNTDGYDVSCGSGITITSATVHNQDDCVVINRGSNIKVADMICIGGHGLSLSVKTDATISNVIFENCKVENSRNGIHVKTMTDGSGSITNVEYVNIELLEITNYGVCIQQDYKSGKSTGHPTANIPIKELTLNNVYGSMSSASKTEPVFILCAPGGCESWIWSKVSITNGKKANSCTNYKPSGFNC